jgi:Ser/Thr protein kinase RdoA (MazF antagonist)
MSEFIASLAELSAEQRVRQYDAIARAAIEHYDLGAVQLAFIQHNSGLVFRVDSPHYRSRFLLKIHEPAGTVPRATAEQIQARLEWLAELRRATGLVVQEPIPNRAGDLLTSAVCGDLTQPFLCTLQRWVEGEHPNGDLTTTQLYQVGALMARLHDLSSHWVAPAAAGIPRYNPSKLSANIVSLRAAIDLGILSLAEYSAIEAVGPLAERAMRDLGEDAQVWGPIHGDLHHDNLLFYRDEIRPIDFDTLSMAHYHADLGVTLYHIFYQGPAARYTLLEGYRSVRHLQEDHLPYLELFLTSGAIDNLAFQISIPEQRMSRLFAHNMRQMAVEFCGKLIEGQPFVFD